MLRAEVGADGVLELADEGGYFGQQLGGDDFSLQRVEKIVLADDARTVSTRLDGTDIFGGEGSVQCLRAGQEGDTALCGDSSGYVDLDPADGVDHGSQLVHLDCDVVVWANAEVIHDELGDDACGSGIFLNLGTGGSLVGVFEGDAKGGLWVVGVIERRCLNDEVAGEGDDTKLLRIVINFDKTDGVGAVGGIALGGV